MTKVVDFNMWHLKIIGERSAEGACFLCLHAYLDVSFPQQTHLNARARKLSIAAVLINLGVCNSKELCLLSTYHPRAEAKMLQEPQCLGYEPLFPPRCSLKSIHKIQKFHEEIHEPRHLPTLPTLVVQIRPFVPYLRCMWWTTCGR